MAFPPGFSYVYGPYRTQAFEVVSDTTFSARNPVSADGSGRILQFDMGQDNIAGIALSASSHSRPVAGRNVVDVLIPEEGTIFATKVQDTADSNVTAFQAYALELNTNHLRVDVDSTATKVVQIVPRQDGFAGADSADSTVFVRVLDNFVQPFGGSGSTTIVP